MRYECRPMAGLPGPPTGTVSGLMVKPTRGEAMSPRPRADVIAGHGFVGDCHAQPLGPRQVLIVREESLAGLGVAPWQVRANIATRGIAEEALESGAVLRVGAAVRIRITHVCEVCKVLRRHVDEATFRALPRRRGSLGVFLDGGPVRLGDAITVEPARFPEVPEGIYERFAWVLERVPVGRVVTYKALLTLVGAQRPYFRVLPTYLKRAARSGLPAHRVLTSAGQLTGHIADQQESLVRERVPFGRDGKAILSVAHWRAEDLYVQRV